MTVDEDTLRLEKIDIIKLTLLNGLDMTLSNIAFAQRYDSNLIFFRQLREANILYYNQLESMILKRAGIIMDLA